MSSLRNDAAVGRKIVGWLYFEKQMILDGYGATEKAKE